MLMTTRDLALRPIVGEDLHDAYHVRVYRRDGGMPVVVAQPLHPNPAVAVSAQLLRRKYQDLLAPAFHWFERMDAIPGDSGQRPRFLYAFARADAAGVVTLSGWKRVWQEDLERFLGGKVALATSEGDARRAGLGAFVRRMVG